MALTDKDMALDCLNTQKFGLSNFNLAAMECTDDALRRDLLTILQEEHQAQNQLFKLANQKGWYKVRSVDQNDLTNLWNKVSAQASQLQAQRQGQPQMRI